MNRETIATAACVWAAFISGFGLGDSHAADLQSASFILRQAAITVPGGPAETDGGSLWLVGASSSLADGGDAMVGEDTGVMLFGGLWPAGVGAALDRDRDLAPDVTDNCTVERNTLQIDVDEDSYGNACDPDITNDGIVNFADMAQLKAVFFRRDPLADLNGDGVVNFIDLAIMKKAFFKRPGPAARRP